MNFGFIKRKLIRIWSAEAEYISATDAVCEAVWLKRIFLDIFHEEKGPTIIRCDNMSVIAMTKNSVFYNRTKHIENHFHFIRDLVKKDDIQLEFVNTNKQLVDVFTKAITIEKFQQARDTLGITN